MKLRSRRHYAGKVLTLKNARNVFRLHYSGVITIAHFGFVIEKTRVGKTHDYGDYIFFEKLRFKMFSVHTKTKNRCFEIPSVSEWAVGQTVEI